MTRSHLHLRARPGRRDELLRELDRLGLFVVMSEQPGLLRVEALVAQADEGHILVDASWSSQELFARRQSSDRRRSVLSSLNGLLESDPEESAYRLVDAFG